MGGARLSEMRLSSIKARNRYDFLVAFEARRAPPAPPAAARGKGGRALRSSAGAGAPRPRPSVFAAPPLRASADTVRTVRGERIPDGDDGDPDETVETDGEDDVPPYLNEARLDALDHIYDDDTELRAIVRWMRTLRREAGCRLRESDVDLTNGVALLEALCVVEPALFPIPRPPNPVEDLESALHDLTIASRKQRAEAAMAEETDPASAPPSRPASTIVLSVPLLPSQGPPGPQSPLPPPSVEDVCGVKKDIDQEGKASAHNMQLLREKMNAFQIHDWQDGGRLLGPASFDKIGPWQLPGYILFIALNGTNREYFYKDMLDWDRETSASLETIFISGLDSFQMVLPAGYELPEQRSSEGSRGQSYVEYTESEVIGEEHLSDGGAENGSQYGQASVTEPDIASPVDDDKVGRETGQRLVKVGDRLQVIETDPDDFEEDELEDQPHDPKSDFEPPAWEKNGEQPEDMIVDDHHIVSPPRDGTDESGEQDPQPKSRSRSAGGSGQRKVRPPQRIVRKTSSLTDSKTQTPSLPVSNMKRQTQTLPKKSVWKIGTQTPSLETSEQDSLGWERAKEAEKEIEILTKCANRNEDLVRSERAVRRGLEEKAAMTQEHIKRQDALIKKLSAQLEENRAEVEHIRSQLEALREREKERSAARAKKRVEIEEAAKRGLPRSGSRKRIQSAVPVSMKETRATRAAAATAVQRHKAEAAALRRKLADAERRLAMKEKTEEKLRNEVERNAKKGSSFSRRLFTKRSEPVK